MIDRIGTRSLVACCLAAGLLVGCGKSPSSVGSNSKKKSDVPGPPPVASIGFDDLDGTGIVPVSNETTTPGRPRQDVVDVRGGAKKGTAEWYLEEIDVLRTASLPRTGTRESLAAEIEKRNLKITELALQAIVLTHGDRKTESLFIEATKRLFEARLQLALTGSEEHARQLYQDAEDFHERNPQCTAAAIGARTLLRYAQSNAQTYSDDPEWVEEYARQARLFARNYPNESEVAAAALAGAGRSCELHGFDREARRCYALLVDKYPETNEGRLAAGILRRLDLVGKPFQLKGATIDGGFTSIEDHSGRVVLVMFWNTTAKSCRDQLATVEGMHAKYNRFGLNVVGVNLDTEQATVTSFLRDHAMPWPQLFQSDRRQRGWQHPVAEWYGVRDVPTYVVVDHTGVARHVGRDAAALEEPIREQLLVLRDAVRGTRGN